MVGEELRQQQRTLTSGPAGATMRQSQLASAIAKEFFLSQAAAIGGFDTRQNNRQSISAYSHIDLTLQIGKIRYD